MKKKDLELMTSHSSGYKTSSEKCLYDWCITWQVWWRNVKLFFSYSKNYIYRFKQATHDKLLHFHLSLWIWKVWKGREKLQKFEYLQKERSILDEIKSIFCSIWRSIIWWKNKKIVETGFKNGSKKTCWDTSSDRSPDHLLWNNI